jgi:hypothetical protein
VCNPHAQQPVFEFLPLEKFGQTSSPQLQFIFNSFHCSPSQRLRLATHDGFRFLCAQIIDCQWFEVSPLSSKTPLKWSKLLKCLFKSLRFLANVPLSILSILKENSSKTKEFLARKDI